MPNTTGKNGAVSAATASLLRELLAGQIPADVRLATYGAWEPTVRAILEATETNGADGARRAFAALARDNPELSRLVASGAEKAKTSWSASELFQADFPEPRWAVPGLIPVGLSSLAGRPKLGKSWLALQLAVAVGTGGRFLGGKVAPGAALFLALEDSPRRLKDRLHRQGSPGTTKIHFETSWIFFNDGGLDALQERLQAEDFSLVIVDTFSRALGHADQMDGAEMTVLLGQLQQLAISRDLALVLIDHHRKNSSFSSDPIDDIMGSTAKAAVLDAALGLYREPGRQGATLKVIGREIEGRDLALEWDPQLCCWQMMGEAGVVRRDTLKADVYIAIQEMETLGELTTPTKIANHLGREKGNIGPILADLLAIGKIRKGEKQGRQQPYETLT